jgi:hypothetical protein
MGCIPGNLETGEMMKKGFEDAETGIKTINSPFH